MRDAEQPALTSKMLGVKRVAHTHTHIHYFDNIRTLFGRKVSQIKIIYFRCEMCKSVCVCVFLRMSGAKLVWPSSTRAQNRSRVTDILIKTSGNIPLFSPLQHHHPQSAHAVYHIHVAAILDDDSRRLDSTRKQLKVQEAMRKKEKFQREHEEVSDVLIDRLWKFSLTAALLR